MASGIEFFTGFEGCGSLEDITSLLNGVGPFATYSATGGFNNGKCLSKGSTNRATTKNCTASKTKASGHHRSGQNLSTNNGSGYSVMTFTGPDIRFLNYDSGGLRCYRGTTLLGTASDYMPTTLTHIEAIVFSDVSAGTVLVKMDGAEILNLSGVNTGGADITSVVLGNTATVLIDNFYIADSLQGELISQLIKPSSDASVQFTPSTGANNWELVDDTGQDGDSTYVQADTVGHKDLYGYEDLPSGYSPKAVSLVTVTRKDDAGARGLTPVVKHDSTEYDQVETTLVTVYPTTDGSAVVNVLDEAPDATDWSVTKVNALQAGFKVST